MVMLPDDRMDVQTLVQALDNYVDAKRAHDNARDAYMMTGGYSWGYFGQDHVNRMNNAATEFGKQLDAYIDARVAAKLAGDQDASC